MSESPSDSPIDQRELLSPSTPNKWEGISTSGDSDGSSESEGELLPVAIYADEAPQTSRLRKPPQAFWLGKRVVMCSNVHTCIYHGRMGHYNFLYFTDAWKELHHCGQATG